ncbi:MAG: M43 family zinc metalloprotease, partial [Bacteroidota bacterium]
MKKYTLLLAIAICSLTTYGQAPKSTMKAVQTKSIIASSGTVQPYTGIGKIAKQANYPVSIAQPVSTKVHKPIGLQKKVNNSVKIDDGNYIPPHRTCGTMEVHERLLQEDPGYAKRMQQMESAIQTFINNQQNYKAGTVISIPVVVHVVWKTASQNISDAQIQSQIDVLNEDFRRLNSDASNTPTAFLPMASDPEIEFCLASKDPLGSPTNGITRTNTSVTTWTTDNKVKYSSQGGKDVWDRNKYLNIWVCNLGGGLLGYAQFPGGNAATDGVVAHYLAFGTIGTASPPYHKGRTSTHEIGHWLGLYHVWGDDGGACTGSDFVGDTPNQGDNYYGCPSYPQTSCSSSDMFMNYMDYVDDGCSNIFTIGQSSRMNGVLNSTRASLKTSDGCEPTGPPAADFVASATTIVYGGNVTFTDLTTGVPATWDWDFGGGGTPNTSTVKNPVITFNTIGTYDVTLTVQNVFGTDPEIKLGYIDVVPLQGCGSTIFSEDFSGGGLPAGWQNIDNLSGGTWAFNNPGGRTINTPTESNGFAIFDSDDLGNDGQAEDADLITPMMDATSLSGVALSFSHFFESGAWGEVAEVLVSNNGGSTYTSVASWSTPSTANAQTENIDITAIAAGNDSVMIKFNWTGDWAWWWAIDDISVGEPHGNNLALDSINQFFYTLTPLKQTTPITFIGKTTNNGLNPQSGTTLNVDVTGADTYNGNSTPIVLASGTNSVLSASPSFTPANLGNYDIDFSVTQDSTDCVPGDNLGSGTFYVTDTVFARDHNSPAYEVDLTSFGLTGVGYEFAMLYEVATTDDANSISILLGPSTVAGTQIRGKIYDDDAGWPNIAIGQTALYTVQAGDIFTGFVTIPFTSPVSLTPGSYYAALEETDSEDEMTMILEDNTPDYTSFLYDATDGGDGAGWYYIGYVSYIRLNFAYTPPPNDLALEGVGFTEYSLTPLSQVFPITFYGLVANNGGDNQTNVKFEVEVTGSGYFSDSSVSVPTLVP